MTALCTACQTVLANTDPRCSTCGAAAPTSAWAKLWQEGYNPAAADPAIHAAHQIHTAESILQSPDEHDRAAIVWARTVLCS
jgi:hypothetical protein